MTNPTPTTEERLREIEALRKAATPGPWAAQETQRGGEDPGVGIIGLRLGDNGQPLETPTNGLVAAALPWPTEIDDNDYQRVEANAASIVALHNAFPDLAAALREARVENERLRAALIAIEEGTYNRVVSKTWRADGKPSKLDLCAHGVMMNYTCEGCIDAHINRALNPKGDA